MSRLFLLLLPLAATACSAPPPQSGPPQAAATFAIPMDPGAIGCTALSNPAALSAAVDWSTGQARAGVISGARSTLPDPAQIGAALQTYCRANPASSIRAATRQLAL